MTLKTSVAKIALALTLASACSFANAALIEADWQNTGDNLAVLDTSSQLEWLDLSETQNLTYDSVVNDLSTTYMGWRLPSVIELTAMYDGFLINKVIQPAGYFDYYNGSLAFAEGVAFNGLFQSSGTSPFAQGIYQDAGGTLRMIGAQVSSIVRIFDFNFGGVYAGSAASFTRGTFLVRNVAIVDPGGESGSGSGGEPGGSELPINVPVHTGFGLIGLGLLAWRRR